jgi:hypothetical protein
MTTYSVFEISQGTSLPIGDVELPALKEINKRLERFDGYIYDEIYDALSNAGIAVPDVSRSADVEKGKIVIRALKGNKPLIEMMPAKSLSARFKRLIAPLADRYRVYKNRKKRRSRRAR